MSERWILRCDIFPEGPAAACTNFRVAVRCMVLITIDRTFCTASVCDEYEVVFSKDDAFFYAIYLAFDRRCDLLVILEFKDHVGNFCVELEVNACFLQIFLHWKDQGFVLVVFGEFQGTEIRKSCNVVDETLEVKLHLQGTVPVFECEHGSPVQPEGGIKYFIVENILDGLIVDVFDDEVFNSTFWLYWRTMFAFENWHSALEMKLYFQRFIHHIAGLPDFSALKFTKYNQYESLILPMQKYLEDAGVDFQFNTEVTNVIFDFKDGKKIASAIECKVNGVEKGIVLTENDLVFVTNGSCTEGTIYGDQNHAPNGDAEVRTSGCWSLWKNIAAQDPSFGHPEKFCSDINKTNWESATVTTLDDKIIPYITDICKRDPRTGKVVTGGIVSCQDSKWLLSWTINRQGQFKDQDKDKVCVWVYGLFTDVPGDYIKKPMKDCTGKEITAEWLYHLGVPEDQIDELAEHSAVCVPTMMPYITAFFMPRTKGDRPDVIPDGYVNFAFLGQFADTPRDTVFTTEYSVRTAMEAVYGLLGVDRGVPEVWGSVYDIRELLSSSVKLMDGKSPLEIDIPGVGIIKKPLLHFIKGTVIEKVLRDYDVLKDGM